MRIKVNRIAPLLAVGAAAVAIAAAPIAAAAPTGTTNGTGSTVQQTPGNVQITAVPGPAAQQAAQLQLPFGGDMGALLFHHGGHTAGIADGCRVPSARAAGRPGRRRAPTLSSSAALVSRTCGRPSWTAAGELSAQSQPGTTSTAQATIGPITTTRALYFRICL